MALPIDLRMDGRRRRLMGALQTLGVLVLLAAIAGIPLAVGVNTFMDHRSLKKEWTLAGRACPVVARISPAARGAKPPPPFTYLGTHFAYQIGDVECADVPAESVFDPSHHTVCQFDAAGAVEVTTGGRTTIFEPGVGHGAMVTVHKGGAVSCVISASGQFHGPQVGRKLQEAQARDAARR
jgi:hypothetical protein